ncbi:MAG TPA: Eco57I restriction-modification methylase domain-containing protein [Thermomicrobiales bacterium]|nr:Eco57I restriction-modification methylase domain-containing protein [Thermomicrobiales bacterium]
MSALQLPLVAQPHHNQQLFSDYYLDVILPQRPDWRMLAAGVAPLMAQIAAVYARYEPSTNEAQLERDLVRPVLEALEHTFEVQAHLKTPDGTKVPDYVFYHDHAALVANKDKVLTDTLLQAGGLAVGDAKAWDRPLDVTLKTKSGDPFSNKNPSYQIAFYIQHSGLEWGILTNGRLWRLYHKDTAHKLDRFYEVDLPALLATNDPDQFVYFAAFFQRAAFDPHPLGVAALLRASADYARGVSETLKAQVYEALRQLAQGFLDYPGNTLAPDAATLTAIYDNALIVLYRLLFILYAEARGLLPVEQSPLYRNTYSLRAITRAVARDVDLGTALLPATALLWPRLRQLFDIIDRGSPPLSVATFNGGLFDPARHPFLERYTVGDARLQAALDRLARVNGQFVDYRDLAERHLGTIYEGLLEYHLAPIEREGDWTVALLNDKGERHATGSYYTPDYIVKYIVEQAVGPVLRAAVAGKETDAEKITAVLGVNVLDPAMGSGHFPVEATEYIARFLVDLAVAPDADAAGETDLAYWKRRVAQSCIYGVDLNPLAVDLAKLSLWLSTVAKDRPLSFLDHHLRAGNALVGARMADLQLAAPARQKAKQPRKQERRAATTGQLSMLADPAFLPSLSSAVGAMWEIEGTDGDTIAAVKRQEQIYAAIRDDLNRKYGRLADVATATAFGLAIERALWTALADYATGRTIAAPAKFNEWLAAAGEMAAERHFFHWELEFPEVFFDRAGQPLGARAGFDAVIGNPPYIRQEDLAPFKSYYAQQFPDVYHGVADIFVYFFGQGVRLLRRGGLLAYISSNSWLRANYATPLRACLRDETTVEAIVDLGDNRVFADAPDVYPAIGIVQREPPAPDQAARVAVFTRGEGVANFAAQVAAKSFPVTIHDQADSGWQLTADAGRKVFAKLMVGGRPLGSVLSTPIYFGIKTGLNEAFIINQASHDYISQESPALLKRIVRGQNLRPWYSEDNDEWMIVIPCGWTQSTFGNGKTEADYWALLRQQHPRLANHLAKFEAAARKRTDMGEFWWELRPCSYYPVMDGAKILWPDLAKQPRFVMDPGGTYAEATVFFTGSDSYYLLGVLQSRPAWFCISNLCHHLGERAGMMRYRLKTQYLVNLPIPDAPAAEREAIGALAMQLTAEARARYDLHERTRRRIGADLGAPGKALNQRLTAWWELDFAAFRAELGKVFKRDIAVKERDEWDAWLAAQRVAHERHTGAIVGLETELNARVYALFCLAPAEIQIIEESTKYHYGEV